MRLWFWFCSLLLPLAALAGPVPPELDAALKDFRTEGTRGWSFTQTTVAGKQSLVERYNPVKPEFNRWTLLKKDGREPTEAERKDYLDRLSRRSRGDTAPDVKKNLDLASCEKVREEGDRAAYKFRLKPGADDDKSAAHMAVTFTFHQPTRTIERVELASFEPFSPMFMVKIDEARTVLDYSLPEGDRPTLLKEVKVKVRGTTMWFKSLNEDMTVTYSDYEYAGKKP